MGGFVYFAPKARAIANPCIYCNPQHCISASVSILTDHFRGQFFTRQAIQSSFVAYRQWLYGIFWANAVLPAMMRMTEQLTTVGMHQMLSVGALMDAKTQLETLRLQQELKARAMKDYQPSQNFCWFGTNARSLSATESMSHLNSMAYNRLSMKRHLGANNMAGASNESDKNSRWQHFRSQNCLRTNNRWDPANPTTTGLQPACGANPILGERVNADVSFGRVIDQARTIRVNFTNGGIAPLGQNSPREDDILMLARNLYGHQTLKSDIPALERKASQLAYLDLRAVAAKRNVAENSFAAIMGLKSSGSALTNSANPTPPNTRDYIASIMRDLGTNPNEILGLIGEDPSYYVQLETLAKRIYQDANFYAGLYDKPENVERTSAALRAIELMLDRAIFESRLRQEMVTSVLLSSNLESEYDAVMQKIDPK